MVQVILVLPPGPHLQCTHGDGHGTTVTMQPVLHGLLSKYVWWSTRFSLCLQPPLICSARRHRRDYSVCRLLYLFNKKNGEKSFFSCAATRPSPAVRMGRT